MASAARCDSAPGRLKLSSGCPPIEELSMKTAAATGALGAMTRHAWRPAQFPMRYTTCDMEGVPFGAVFEGSRAVVLASSKVSKPAAHAHCAGRTARRDSPHGHPGVVGA